MAPAKLPSIQDRSTPKLKEGLHVPIGTAEPDSHSI